jgi:hypothetical protein
LTRDRSSCVRGLGIGGRGAAAGGPPMVDGFRGAGVIVGLPGPCASTGIATKAIAAAVIRDVRMPDLFRSWITTTKHSIEEPRSTEPR